MRFSQDYAQFFEIHGAEGRVVETTRRDFTSQLARLLARLGIAAEKAAAIAADLWVRMSGQDRHYHTGVHVLSMLSCADRAGIALSADEELAIWFHDAVYEVGTPPGDNERKSAVWMEHLLLPAGADEQTVRRAADAIRWTACHLEESVPAPFHRVMDLDLWGLAADPQTFMRQSSAVRAELLHLSDEQYSRGTIEFFQKLLKRPHIYRTPNFARFERVARDQVRHEIDRLARKIPASGAGGGGGNGRCHVA